MSSGVQDAGAALKSYAPWVKAGVAYVAPAVVSGPPRGSCLLSAPQARAVEKGPVRDAPPVAPIIVVVAGTSTVTKKSLRGGWISASSKFRIGF